MEAGNLRTEKTRRGDKERGEKDRAEKGRWGGSGRFSRRKEGIWRRDLEGDGRDFESRGEECCDRTTDWLAF